MGSTKNDLPRITRNSEGVIVRGKGSKMTEKQELFMQELYVRGKEDIPNILRELNYTSFHRDKQNYGSALHQALLRYTNEYEQDVSVAKGENIRVLQEMRDNAIAEGNTRVALECIKIINDMQGYKAPTKVEQTKFDITATIDLTKKDESEDIGFIDITGDDEE